MKTYISTICALALLLPVVAFGEQGIYEQEFVVTAYYSPLPGQCCYVRGSYEADKILNGEGHTAADGTAVFDGLAAAPPSYAFGTRIALPGIGTVAVHDRGGAIQEWQDGVHRLDIWVGHGEEGLARALAFGVQRMRGTVYLPSARQPAVAFSPSSLPAPTASLAPLQGTTNVLGTAPAYGDRSVSARRLQGALQSAGYFDHGMTGYFGPVTEQSLQAFLVAMGLEEPSDVLTDTAAAYLDAARERVGASAPIRGTVDASSAAASIAAVQRTLRFLGYYEGRTHGRFDENLRSAILRFQMAHGIVHSSESQGAGRIGPQTKAAITHQWNRRLVARRAAILLEQHRVVALLIEQGKVIDRYLSAGNAGRQVRLLQTMLADRGFFPYQEINGHFGPLTEQAVLAFQHDRGIIESSAAPGAGTVGPRTLAVLQAEERTKAYRLVRAEGWHML